MLEVWDVPYIKDKTRAERDMRCPGCGAWNSTLGRIPDPEDNEA